MASYKSGGHWKFVLAGLVGAASATTALAADVTLRMRGGDFTFTGALRSADAAKYVITVPKLGTMTLDATRFECISGACPGSAAAQAASNQAAPATAAASGADLTLRMRGGDFTFTGRLVSFDNQKYTIRLPSLGMLSLDATRFDCVSGACPRGPTGNEQAAVASNNDITLKMRGGDFTFTGKLLSYDTAKYAIRLPSLGTLTLDATRFDCVSGDCPKAATGGGATLVSAQRSAPSTVTIAGSNAIGGQLMPALVEGYAKSVGARASKIVGTDANKLEYKLTSGDNQEVAKIILNRPGSAVAFSELGRGAAQIGMSTRQIKPDEAQRLIAAGLPDLRRPGNEHVVGLDGTVVLLAPGNPAVSLPLDTIAQIFAGRITDWSQVGLPPRKITVYAPDQTSGNFETFDAVVMKPRNLEIAASAKRSNNLSELSDMIARDVSGIGFAGFAYQRNAKALNIETSCGLIAAPNMFTVKTEEYPLGQRLFLYTNGEPTDGIARGLLNYALSPAAQSIIKQNEFVDQLPERLGYGEQASRIANALNAPRDSFDLKLMNTLIGDLNTAERLSLTYRFDTASDALDIKALSDVARLHDLLGSQEMRGAQVFLVGFADSVGRFDNNLRLSQRRALSVLTALTAFNTNNAYPGGTKVSIKAFSTLAPVACNEVASGRNLNRRVEVWVKR